MEGVDNNNEIKLRDSPALEVSGVVIAYGGRRLTLNAETCRLATERGKPS